MTLPQPLPGLVIHYAYLWHDEHQRGFEEGIKDRPCVIVSAKETNEGNRLVMAVPITHRHPGSPKDAIEIPAITKQRLGLDTDRSWIILNDLNRFRWPGPDLRPVPGHVDHVYAYGFLPSKLYQTVRDGVLESAKRHRSRLTPR